MKEFNDCIRTLQQLGGIEDLNQLVSPNFQQLLPASLKEQIGPAIKSISESQSKIPVVAVRISTLMKPSQELYKTFQADAVNERVKSILTSPLLKAYKMRSELLYSSPIISTSAEIIDLTTRFDGALKKVHAKLNKFKQKNFLGMFIQKKKSISEEEATSLNTQVESLQGDLAEILKNVVKFEKDFQVFNEDREYLLKRLLEIKNK